MWENLVPFWRSENDQVISPNANSNPILQYVKWIVAESVGYYDPGR